MNLNYAPSHKNDDFVQLALPEITRAFEEMKRSGTPKYDLCRVNYRQVRAFPHGTAQGDAEVFWTLGADAHACETVADYVDSMVDSMRMAFEDFGPHDLDEHPLRK